MIGRCTFRDYCPWPEVALNNAAGELQGREQGVSGHASEPAKLEKRGKGGQ